MRIGLRTLALSLLAGMLAFPAAGVQAQSVPSAAKKKDPNVAIKAFDTGKKAYSAGKYKTAIDSLTKALKNGGLSPQKMATAYYYRGLSQKKQNKPAQALSDLTVAVWVKGGLSPSDQAAAMQARNEVYRAAGLGNEAPPIANAVAAPSPSSKQQAAAVQPAPAPPQQPAATQAPAPSTPPVWQAAPNATRPQPSAPTSLAAAVTPSNTPPPAATATAPAARPVWQADPESTPPPPLPLDTGTSVQTARAPAPQSGNSAPVATLSPAPASSPETISTGFVTSAETATVPQQQTTTDVLSPIANAGSSISGFFSNMFGGNNSNQPQAQPPQPTTTTGSTLPSGPRAQVSASEPQRAPGYKVAAAPPAAPPQPAPVPPAAPAAPSATASTSSKPVARSASGRYRLQVASVRSRAEADSLAQTVMAFYSGQLGDAKAEIDETVIGNMGTFYRVRLGPYANAAEPRKLCSTLKPQGFDCQVVTQ